MSIVSACVPQVAFRDAIWERVKRSYIDPKVNAFFRERGVDHVWEVSADEAIVDREYQFKSRGGVPFHYFYDVLLKGIKRDKSGKIVGVGYTLTFDKDLVGLEDENAAARCDKSGLYYSPVHLGKAPVFYYLYLDLQKIICQAKKLNEPAQYPA